MFIPPIGAALERMSQGGLGPAAHIASKGCNVGMFRKTRKHVVKHLRSVVAVEMGAFAQLLRHERLGMRYVRLCFASI